MSNQQSYWLKIAQYDLDTADSMLKQLNIDIPIKRYIEALEEKVKVSKVV